MNIIYVLIALYPCYYTGECIRSWDKTKKIYFQRLCVIWLVYFVVLIIRDILYYILSYFYFLSIYDIIAVTSVLISYNSIGTSYMRTFIILPCLREIRKRIYPTIKFWLDTIIKIISNLITLKTSFNILSNENVFLNENESNN